MRQAAIAFAIAALSVAVPGTAQVISAAQAGRAVRFDVRTISGEVLTVGAHQPPTLVAVFATWCRSCRDEVATLNALHAELAARGVRLIALNVDKTSDDAVRRWLDGAKGTYPVALDTAQRVSTELRVIGVPEFHLISGDGRVVFVRRGPLGSSLEKLREAVKRL